MSLEARYRRLLRAYPASWRAVHEDELVATYLDVAPQGRERPSAADTLDALRGAVRVWLRTDPPGLDGGARIAGLLAATTVAALSGLFLTAVESGDAGPYGGHPAWGPFTTPAAAAWLLWIAYAFASPFAPPAWARRIALLPVVATGALILIDRTGSWDRPERLILLPMVTLGAFALCHVPRGRLRFLPMTAAVAGAGIGLPHAFDDVHPYGMVLFEWEYLRNTGMLLAAAALLVLLVSALRNRGEGAWAFILCAPMAAALTYSEITGYAFDFGYRIGFPNFDLFDGYLLGVSAVGVLAVTGLELRARVFRPPAKGVAA